MALCALFLALHVHQFLVPATTYPLLVHDNGPIPRGGDYYDFYVAAARLPQSPYAVPGFNKPPFVSLLNVPFAALDYGVALRFWQCLIVLVVALIVARLCRAHGEGRLAAPMLFLATSVSAPFQLLLDRGQLEGFSYALAIAAFLCVDRGRVSLAAALFGLAVHVKPQVAFLFPALFVHLEAGRWRRLLAWAVAVIVGVGLLTPEWTLEFLSIAGDRAQLEARSWDNGSLARAIHFLPNAELIGALLWLSLGATFYWYVFRGRRALAQRLQSVDLCFLALPFCQAFPATAFVYGLVYFPLISLTYFRRSGERSGVDPPPALAGWVMTGIVLSQFPAVGFAQRFGMVGFFYWLPSLGVLYLVLASLATARGYSAR